MHYVRFETTDGEKHYINLDKYREISTSYDKSDQATHPFKINFKCGTSEEDSFVRTFGCATKEERSDILDQMEKAMNSEKGLRILEIKDKSKKENTARKEYDPMAALKDVGDNKF